MKYIQALIALGLFVWLAHMTFTGTLPGGEGGSRKGMALRAMVDRATEQFGVETTSVGLLCVGVLLAAFFLTRHGQYEE